MKRLLSILLTICLLFTAFPLTVQAAKADKESVSANAVTTGTGDSYDDLELVFVSDAEKLQDAMISDGDKIIELSNDIEYRIGYKSNVRSPFISYWITLGKGHKILNLCGYDITLCNDHQKAYEEDGHLWNYRMTMFNVAEGAELTINDNDNKGTINYDGFLGEVSYHPCEPRTRACNTGVYYEVRNLIEVQNGGKLTVNGGCLEAGRSDKQYINSEATYYYRQINGFAIYMNNGGEATINGGIFHGRGFWSCSNKRCAAIRADGAAKLTINDGKFWGKGCADVLQIEDTVDITIRGGYFDTHRQDYDIAFKTTSTGILAEAFGTISTSYGNTGIPASAFAGLANCEVYKKGKLLSEQDISNNVTDNTTNRVEVKPAKTVSRSISYLCDGVSKTNVTGTVSVTWDKVSQFKMTLLPKNTYFPIERTIDYIDHHYGNQTVTFSASPDGKAVSKELDSIPIGGTTDRYHTWQKEVDLNELSDSVKEQLIPGKTYYVKLTGYEYRKQNHEYKQTTVYSGYIMLTIKKPEYSNININLDFDWSYNSDKGWLEVTPTGEASYDNIDAILNSNRASSFVVSFCGLRSDGTAKVETYNENIYCRTFVSPISNMYKGMSDLTMRITFYGGDKQIGFASCHKNVYNMHNITSTPLPDDSNEVLFKASDTNKKVTLKGYSGDYSNCYWTKNGVKISGTDSLSSYSIADAGTATGWYCLTYDLDGNVICSNAIYVGLIYDNDYSARIEVTKSIVDIYDKNSGSTTFSVKTEGSGWGDTITKKWELVTWPREASPGFKKITSDTVDLHKFFYSDPLNLVSGGYYVQCTVKDNYGHSITVAPYVVIVHVHLTGISITKDGKVVSGKNLCVYDLNTKMKFGYKTVPDNYNYLGGDDVEYRSTDTSVASVDRFGFVTFKKPGKTSIIISTTSTSPIYEDIVNIYVANTKYNITIPESMLTAKVGEKVPNGEVLQSSSNCSVFLNWYAKGYGSEEVFAANYIYFPIITIKTGSDPIPVDPADADMSYYYTNDEVMTININGQPYYGAGTWDTSYITEIDSITQREYSIRLPDTERLIDENGTYLSDVNLTANVPMDGDIYDYSSVPISKFFKTKEDGVNLSYYGCYEITDLSTILDDSCSNDAQKRVETGDTFKEGKTYRFDLFVYTSDNNTQSSNKVYLNDNLKIQTIEPNLKTLTSILTVQGAIAHIYFTVGENDLILPYNIGDVNCDGEINIIDATEIQKHIAQLITFDKSQLAVADTNGDGEVNIIDVTQIQKYIAQLIDKLG